MLQIASLEGTLSALIRDLPECPSAALMTELGTITQLLVKLAQLNAWAQGRSIASLVVARRQLWLSQARVQEPDKASLLDAGPLSDWVRHHYSNAKNGFLVVFSPEKAKKTIALPNGSYRSRDKSKKKGVSHE
ncbi:UNVERIFIED_CONTAM: hypothetical protein FKN15_052200 [Acipenser sinensis]